MALGTWLIGTLVVGAGVAGGALISRAALGRMRPIPPLDDDDIEIIEVEDYHPWEYIEIEEAMPTQLDFPQGWVLHDEGADGNDNWALSWKILELNSPPYAGAHFVTVVSAQAPGYSKGGWGTAHTRDQAFEQINLIRRQVSGAGAAAS